MEFGEIKDGICTDGDRMTALPKEVPIEPGNSVLLEFITDNRNDNNGDGFRIEW
uniref:CUB domain-containing protein n=1 Tax=Parascaris equorum TaxID=6256 RepID=A0A914S248_PAREQ